jgi:pimeloyl-ACP methyl ester carboxylesterase
MFFALIFWIYAMFLEIFAILGIIGLRILSLSLDSKNKGGRPILLIHGYINHGSVWFFQKRKLEKLGLGPIYTVNLGNPLLSIETYAEKVRSKAEAISRLTGHRDLILIGHSMGGVVASWYATHYPNQVTDLITIGSPLAGTYAAYIGFGQAAKEMRPGSKLIKELRNLLEKEKKFRIYHIGSENDQLILPSQSAFLKGNPRKEMRGIGHVSLLYSNKVAEQIYDWLRNL